VLARQSHEAALPEALQCELRRHGLGGPARQPKCRLTSLGGRDALFAVIDRDARHRASRAFGDSEDQELGQLAIGRHGEVLVAGNGKTHLSEGALVGSSRQSFMAHLTGAAPAPQRRSDRPCSSGAQAAARDVSIGVGAAARRVFLGDCASGRRFAPGWHQWCFIPRGPP
jgi:hypothetical protein